MKYIMLTRKHSWERGPLPKLVLPHNGKESWILPNDNISSLAEVINDYIYFHLTAYSHNLFFDISVFHKRAGVGLLKTGYSTKDIHNYSEAALEEVTVKCSLSCV